MNYLTYLLLQIYVVETMLLIFFKWDVPVAYFQQLIEV
jgi:hypothetical protein